MLKRLPIQYRAFSTIHPAKASYAKLVCSLIFKHFREVEYFTVGELLDVSVGATLHRSRARQVLVQLVEVECLTSKKVKSNVFGYTVTDDFMSLIQVYKNAMEYRREPRKPKKKNESAIRN